MAEILGDAGVPDSVLNVVTGLGSEIGDGLVGHPGDRQDRLHLIDRGRAAHVGHRGGATHAGDSGVEDNAAHIVFGDADLDKAVGAAIKGFVFNTGRSAWAVRACSSPLR